MSSDGSQCKAKISSTSSSQRESLIGWAPPGMTSSAGWKISRVATPASVRVPVCMARASPAPRQAATWTSCPHAWATPGTADE